MKLLVTGGAGYIGAAVSRLLLESGHRVTIFDNLSNGYRKAIPEGAEFVQGDLSDCPSVDAVLAAGAFDAVLHFAAFIEAGESMALPEKYFRNNSANTLNLVEAMLRHRVARIVFSSTAALYGNPERTPITEEARLSPTNAYGESKLLVEKMLAWMHACHGLRYASLRYFNAAGALEDHGEAHQPETHLIPRILGVALGKAPHALIYGTDYPTPDGTCVRDYIHIADLASAHLLALEALDVREKLVYNLGNGSGFSVRQVIETARKVSGHPIAVIEEARRPGDPAVLIASSDKIRSELGWAPRFPSLEAIIEGAWRWHYRQG